MCVCSRDERPEALSSRSVVWCVSTGGALALSIDWRLPYRPKPVQIRGLFAVRRSGQVRLLEPSRRMDRLPRNEPQSGLPGR